MVTQMYLYFHAHYKRRVCPVIQSFVLTNAASDPFWMKYFVSDLPIYDPFQSIDIVSCLGRILGCRRHSQYSLRLHLHISISRDPF